MLDTVSLQQSDYECIKKSLLLDQQKSVWRKGSSCAQTLRNVLKIFQIFPICIDLHVMSVEHNKTSFLCFSKKQLFSLIYHI